MQTPTQRVLTQADFNRFAALSRDDNPIHCDAAFAKTTHFGATVAHGMFLFSLLSAQMTRSLPLPALPIAQTLMFPRPTFVADGVAAVLALRTSPGPLQIALETEIRCLQRGGDTLADPEAQVTAHGQAQLLLDADAIALAAQAASAPIGEAAQPAGDAALYHLRVGQTAQATRAFTTADIDEYAALAGDRNLFYTDAVFARSRGFDGALVPLPLLAGMFSDLLGTRLPGRGTGWMKQSLRLCSAALVDEPLTALVRIVRLRADKALVNLATEVRGADGRLVLHGEALVLVRNLEDKRAEAAA
ncbi:MaoC/PaaZ C-terminal domain-containing protein [uncultured Ralstonia sp.]|jgi:acyl dehydratase|uniref:MaoC/PaaZ C-terminal domain-containing protein n=1 Tax=Ralstonia sp. TaxID=54061 RepID=UPI001EA827A4|nr:MaoC/PaaZ C-terminal domain-containing protein [uncultured Ralstonia sp.]UCF22836.1 MAG: oxidoreductase [Ralstonia sp.]